MVTASLPYVLQSSNYMVNILPSTLQTRGLLSGDVLRHCAGEGSARRPRPPIFINAGRGDVVDEHALVTALDSGWIGGAVHDVFQEEPLPKSSLLWSHDKVLMTPHISAVSYADDVAQLFARNLAL